MRLQPLGFSKELLPVGGCAVIEYLIERMLLAGIEIIFINTAAEKTDLIRYLSSKSPHGSKCVFMVRERKGLLDAIVQPAQFLRDDDELYFGLPDTIWFPTDGFSKLMGHAGEIVLGLFDTGTPERFDSVVTDESGRIQSVEVKVPAPKSKWTWGTGKIRVGEVPRLLALAQRHEGIPLFGSVLHDYANLWPAYGIKYEGSSYLDVGLPEDYARAEGFQAAHKTGMCVSSPDEARV
jgi:glucose-1-phosphate thymidylyltransferase